MKKQKRPNYFPLSNRPEWAGYPVCENFTRWPQLPGLLYARSGLPVPLCAGHLAIGSAIAGRDLCTEGPQFGHPNKDVLMSCSSSATNTSAMPLLLR